MNLQHFRTDSRRSHRGLRYSLQAELSPWTVVLLFKHAICVARIDLPNLCNVHTITGKQSRQSNKLIRVSRKFCQSGSNFLLVDEGREDQNQITTISVPSLARQRNAIEMALRWRADDGQTLNAGFVIFRGSGPVLLRNPIFSGGQEPCLPSGSAHETVIETKFVEG